ncbi:MAG: hypothetical protein ABSF17_04340 [Terracidiphilus sp.]|jgi:hypothetical protein
MLLLDSHSLKKSLPVLLVLLVLAQIDLASAAAWPLPFLSLLHLTPAIDDTSRGICAGLGATIDVLVVFQLLRIFARRAITANRTQQPR